METTFNNSGYEIEQQLSFIHAKNTVSFSHLMEKHLIMVSLHLQFPSKFLWVLEALAARISFLSSPSSLLGKPTPEKKHQ